MNQWLRLPTEPIMICYGSCLGCGTWFPFDPNRVPFMLYDPVAGTTVELGGDPAKATREPICRWCCIAANPRRQDNGFELLPTHDTAEGLG
jgi:hypothetical protein